MMDQAPVPPKYHGTKNVEMTECRRQVWSWYKKKHQISIANRSLRIRRSVSQKERGDK